MKYLQDDSGNIIPIPANVMLFKRTVSFITWAIRGDFSTDFSLPNDSELRKILGYTSINQVDQITNKAFSMFSNGNLLAIGKLFIKSAGTDIEMFFVSGNSNWINRITGSIKDVDFSDFSTAINAPNIDALNSATEGVIFPVIDWMTNFQKLTNKFVVAPVLGVSSDTIFEMYPCIYEHTILERLFDAYGLKLAGPLVDDPIYKSLVITPEQIIPEKYISPGGIYTVQMFVERGGTFGQTINNTTALINMVEVTASTGGADFYTFDSSTSRTTINFDFDTFYINAIANFRLPSGGGSKQVTLSIYKNGLPYASKTVTTTVTFLQIITDLTTDTVAQDDYFQLFATVSGFSIDVGSARISMQLENPVNLVRVKNYIPDIKQIDFVKHIAQRFNCLIDFDEFSQTLTFTPLDTIRKSDAQDISEKIISYKQILSSGYSARNNIRTVEAEELAPFKANDLNFGDAVIESDGEGEQDIFITPFRPASSFINTNLNWLVSYVPLIKLEDADTGIGFTDVTSSGSLIDRFITSLSNFDFDINEIIRIESEEYNGFAVTSLTSEAEVKIHGDLAYPGNFTGKIYKQKISFPFCGSRELIVTRSTSINDFNSGSPIYGDQNIIFYDGSSYPYASAAWAFYAKQNINTNLDKVRVGANYGPIDGMNNYSFGDIYHKTLRKIVTGRPLQCQLLLSETEYYNLVLASYFFIRTKDFSGYFLVSDIGGYIDNKTPVTFNLVLTD